MGFGRFPLHRDRQRLHLLHVNLLHVDLLLLLQLLLLHWNRLRGEVEGEHGRPRLPRLRGLHDQRGRHRLLLLLLGRSRRRGDGRHWNRDVLDLEALQTARAHHRRGVQTDGLDLRRRNLLLGRVQLNLQRLMLLVLLLLDDLQGLMLILRLLQLLMYDYLLLLLLWVLLNLLDLYLLHLRVERQLLLPLVHAFDVLVQVKLSRRLESEGYQ